MLKNSIWITGSTRSGKTTQLVAQFQQWIAQGVVQAMPRRFVSSHRRSLITPAILVFAANDDNRRDLAQQITTAIQGRYPVVAKTPLGFFQDEVRLFWPLLIRRLNLRAQFPLRLRPETEQQLAIEFWSATLEQWQHQLPGANLAMKVRTLLDLLQLAAVSGTPREDVVSILQQGISETEGTPQLWEIVGKMLEDWRCWCLERGLLTYGIICELYWRELLADATYQEHLKQRYRAVLADDLDDYPAIARDLFEYLLDQGAVGAFSYNPDGQVRLGLNADPNYMSGLAARCQIQTLATPPDSLCEKFGDLINESLILDMPSALKSIQTTSRAALLRETANVIVLAVKSGIPPEEMAIIAPGLDAIARYTLTDIFASHGISVEPLNDQRPLISSPMIRALLTLLALVYPGLGRLVDRDAVAEMLVILSQKQDTKGNVQENQIIAHIDPVRAGLLADYCYLPDTEEPRLLAVESFPRWDRLGQRASAAYLEIVQWLEQQRSQQAQNLLPSSCLLVLNSAIGEFLWNGSNLPYDQLSALRELMETAQHYWEVEGRLRQTVLQSDIGRQQGGANNTTIGQFIQLLRRGTVTANPYPVRRLAPGSSGAITLATIFQYRASRRSHRWQFWLDAGSPLWNKGGAASLFGANLFLWGWSGRPLTEDDKQEADQERLQRIWRDLLGRADERVYLCHSELAVNGIEQDGPLLTLVHGAVEIDKKALKL
ncbi:MAG: recombinase family protein [Coleofasciculaceae cyanobacterium]